MINLKTKYGKRYKVIFDQTTATIDREGCGIEENTKDEYYYQIPCNKHGGFVTAMSDGRLCLYLNSVIVLKNIVQKYNVESFISDFDGFVYFGTDKAEDILEYAQAKKRRMISEAEKERLRQYSQKYAFQKGHGTPIKSKNAPSEIISGGEGV